MDELLLENFPRAENMFFSVLDKQLLIFLLLLLLLLSKCILMYNQTR